MAMISKNRSPSSAPVVRRVCVLAAPCAAVMVACAPSALVGVKAPSTQEALMAGKVQCVDGRPSTTPDLMAWDSESRLNLKHLRESGVVAVRYEAHGCDVKMELLSNCIATGTYDYTSYVSRERRIAHDVSDLHAQLPLGGASLEGKVAGDQSVRTDYTLVGEHSLPPDATFKLADLKGADCQRATHVVSAVYVGGFALVTGNEREVDAAVTVFGAGAGAGQSSSVQRLANEGDPQACDEAEKAHVPTEGCNVPLRVGLLPISDAVAVVDPPATGSAANGGAPENAPATAAPTDAPSKTGASPGPGSAGPTSNPFGGPPGLYPAGPPMTVFIGGAAAAPAAAPQGLSSAPSAQPGATNAQPTSVNSVNVAPPKTARSTPVRPASPPVRSDPYASPRTPRIPFSPQPPVARPPTTTPPVVSRPAPAGAAVRAIPPRQGQPLVCPRNEVNCRGRCVTECH